MRDFLADLTNKERTIIVVFVLAASELIAQAVFGVSFLDIFGDANEALEKSNAVIESVGE